ncbi:hypothetical protein [Mannheimia haemolytica]|uniref:hypothetical protein n=1 Tax=Mannheimia haemolytica TaxID=75985 RepID=UPI001CF2B2DF|nr:hypothetical protein [Mannheimia haemolytica]MCB4228224.1 hypothetical protein [Mannheimia haemolytica]
MWYYLKNYHKFVVGMILYEYDYVGGNIFYGVEDIDLNELLKRLKLHTEELREEYQLDKFDSRLDFKFKWGMKKKYDRSYHQKVSSNH